MIIVLALGIIGTMIVAVLTAREAHENEQAIEKNNSFRAEYERARGSKE